MQAPLVNNQQDTRPGSIPYLPGLDGLRAIAVLGVLIYHAGLPLYGGFLGVESFFVLSGFLITTLLLADWEAFGRVRLGLFWWRRARRLLPPLFVLLVGVVLASAVLLPGELGRSLSDILAALAYVTNWQLIVGGQPYFDPIERPSLLQHLWSLAVEEQFYILWPLLLAAGMRLLGRRALLTLTGLAAAASAALMYTLYDPGADLTRVYYGTDTRAAGLLLGCALAFVWRPGHRPALAQRWAGPTLDTLGILALAALLFTYARLGETHPLLYQGGFMLVALATAALVAAVTHPAACLLPRLLELSPMRWIGLRSYSLYLWHWPIFMLTRPGVDLVAEDWQIQTLRLCLTFGLAALTYRLIELPVRAGALERAWAAIERRQAGAVTARVAAPLGWTLRQLVRLGATIALSFALSYVGASVAQAAVLQSMTTTEPEPQALALAPQPTADSPPATPAPRAAVEAPAPTAALPAVDALAPTAAFPATDARAPTAARPTGEARAPADAPDSPVPAAVIATPEVAAAAPAVPTSAPATSTPTVAVAEAAAAPPPDAPELAAQLQAILDDAVADGLIPGVALSVRLPDGSDWTGASGMADRAAGLPMQPAAHVPAGSLSKLFTAVVVLQLAEEGQIGLDAPISAYLPSLLPDGEAITVRMLLQHTSGIYDYLEDRRFVTMAYEDPERVWAPTELVAYANQFPQRFAPGTPDGWDYSSTNYVVLGMLIEHVTGNSLATELDRRIFTPLGLTQTISTLSHSVGEPQARGYSRGIAQPHISLSFAFSTANIVTSVADMRRFGAAFFDGELLMPASMAEMQRFVDGKGRYAMPELQYGLGLMANRLPLGPSPDGQVRSPADSFVLGHIGGINGFRAAIWYAPKRDLLLVVGMNQGSTDPNELASRVLETLLAAP